MPAGAGTPRCENPEFRFHTANSHWGFCHAQARPQRGTSPSPREVFDRTTFPHPYHFWIPAFAGMTESVAGVFPGSGYGTCFRSNRSCRQGPAHQGVKTRSSGFIRRIRTGDSAMPRPDPSGGQSTRLAKSSTALRFLVRPSAMGLGLGRIRRWRAGVEVDWRVVAFGQSRGHVTSSRIGVRDMLSHQSLMLAGAGTPRYENSELRFYAATSHGGFLPCPGPTPAGDKPPHYISQSPPTWIPAFAGMTNVGVRWRTRKPFKGIFVPMTNGGPE